MTIKNVCLKFRENVRLSEKWNVINPPTPCLYLSCLFPAWVPHPQVVPGTRQVHSSCTQPTQSANPLRHKSIQLLVRYTPPAHSQHNQLILYVTSRSKYSLGTVLLHTANTISWSSTSQVDPGARQEHPSCPKPAQSADPLSFWLIQILVRCTTPQQSQHIQLIFSPTCCSMYCQVHYYCTKTTQSADHFSNRLIKLLDTPPELSTAYTN